MRESVFHETTAETRTQAVPLSHASIELGHLYMEEFAVGPERLREHFASVARHLAGLREHIAAAVPKGRPRISTCFLVDDYFQRFSSPAELVPILLAEAEKCGLRIDYLARESGCAVADGHDLAESVLARLVQAPTEGSDGTRPPVSQTGWLCNGERSQALASIEAMSGVTGWRPPSETGARNHDIFIDVQLYKDTEQGRVWSCPFLASVWQLLRLGLLRDQGEVPMRPRAWSGDFPTDWDDLPPLVQLTPGADPFAAYRTWTVLPTQFLPVEHAVHLIVGDFVVEPDALTQAMRRASAEQVDLEPESARRINYILDAEL